ncbi:MAG: PIG-L family deacetylase [Nanoarchaeota archaeon]|nr:PIG-L family deacetylase [Nanoarchaeota archaeon]
MSQNIVIIAPHPDDEWIGCGCKILETLSHKQKVKVLIITSKSIYEKSTKGLKRRILVSKELSKKFNYQIKCLNETSRKININKLKQFLKKEVNKTDLVYIPDYDTHPDHRLINQTSKQTLSNQLFQYCSYNNSINPYTRLINKCKLITKNIVYTSFRKGSPDLSCDFQLKTKINIQKKFKVTPRDKDIYQIN